MIVSMIYHSGYVLTEFRTRFDTLVWFVGLEHSGDVEQFDNEEDAEHRFKELTGAVAPTDSK